MRTLASILACTALTAMIKLGLGVEGAGQIDIQAYLDQPFETRRGVGRYAELFRSHPYLPKRIQALRLFAGSSFYKAFTGADVTGAPSAADVDNQVAEILSVF